MAFTFCRIKDLTLNASSFFISALIIAKTEKRTFDRAGVISGVITFTVRDTKDHIINVSVWGPENFIVNCGFAYKIGDIISIYKATVSQKNNSSAFGPRTTSPFELKVTDGKGFITRSDQQHSANLIQLRNLAFKPTSLALKLDDLKIRPGDEALNVDLVVAVRMVEQGRQVQTKFGEKVARKVYLMDQSMELITMTVWNPDYHILMDDWKPLETVLHLVDVRAEFSEYERTIVLSITSKTIIIENPRQSSRYAEMMAHIHLLDTDKYNQLKSVEPVASISLSSFNEVMSVQRILDQIERDPVQEIHAIVYGVVTRFELSNALIKTCVHCKRFLTRGRTACDSAICNSIQTDGPRTVDKVYMPVSVADHSGSLKGRINNENALRILGYTAQELKELTESEIDAIFKRFMLERFKVTVIVKPKSQTEYTANFLNIETEHPDIMAKAMKP